MIKHVKMHINSITIYKKLQYRADGPGLRKHIRALAKSIREVGVMNALGLYRKFRIHRGKKKLHYVLLTGYCRAEAILSLPKKFQDNIPFIIWSRKDLKPRKRKVMQLQESSGREVKDD